MQVGLCDYLDNYCELEEQSVFASDHNCAR